MNVPRHIGIIMDGNGRWAKKRNLPKIMGHRAGVKSVERITEACALKGVKALTLYSFSTENWKRPQKEVEALMSLLGEGLRNYQKKLATNDIKFNVIGRIEELPAGLRDEIIRLEDLTAKSKGMVLTLALNYGGRQEIVDAVREFCQRCKKGVSDIDSLNEEDFEKFLYTKDLPELDLIIRTSGEMRLSNFLLWQAAYSELYISDVLWPDFGADDLDKALEEFAGRGRRYGG